MSVRPSVRNASLFRAISQKILNVDFQTFFPNNILIEVVQRKIKIQIFPKILKFWPKPLLKFEFYPVHISVTIHFRIAGVFCSVSEYIPIVQRPGHFFKMLDFGRFLAILVSKIVFFLILSLMPNSIHLITNCRPGFANNNSTVAI